MFCVGDRLRGYRLFRKSEYEVGVGVFRSRFWSSRFGLRVFWSLGVISIVWRLLGEGFCYFIFSL